VAPALRGAAPEVDSLASLSFATVFKATAKKRAGLPEAIAAAHSAVPPYPVSLLLALPEKATSMQGAILDALDFELKRVAPEFEKSHPGARTPRRAAHGLTTCRPR